MMDIYEKINLISQRQEEEAEENLVYDYTKEYNLKMRYAYIHTHKLSIP